MTEVLPETSLPAHDHEHEHPAMTATPPHSIPASMPSSTMVPTHHTPTTTHPRSQTSIAHRGREKLPWGKEVWDRLDHAVRREVERTRVAAKFLPCHRVPEKTTSIETDLVVVPAITGLGAGPGGPLAVGGPARGAAGPPAVIRWVPPSNPTATDSNPYLVDEGATTRLVEFWVEFTLTAQQVEHEATVEHDQHGANHHPADSQATQHTVTDPHMLHGQHLHHDHLGHSTAITLATRAANVLAQAEDMLMFNGLGAFTSALFTNFVQWRSNGLPTDFGLLNVVPVLPGTPTPTFPPLPASQVIQVLRPPAPAAGQPPLSYLYGPNTFEAVASGYAELLGNGFYGRAALTLPIVPFADTYAPIQDLAVTADRIVPLMKAGFHDSGTLDTPGATAIAAGVAAAAAALAAGQNAAAQQTAAATAAATYAIDYGAVVGNQTPTANALLNVAAETGSIAAQNQGASAGTADTAGATAAQNAANAIPSFPGAPGIVFAPPITPPALPYYYGSLVIVDGNTMDRVVGIEPTVCHTDTDPQGNIRFRVMERVALRIKDINALIRLEFMGPPSGGAANSFLP